MTFEEHKKTCPICGLDDPEVALCEEGFKLFQAELKMNNAVLLHIGDRVKVTGYITSFVDGASPNETKAVVEFNDFSAEILLSELQLQNE